MIGNAVHHHNTEDSMNIVVFCMIQLNLCLFHTLKKHTEPHFGLQGLHGIWTAEPHSALEHVKFVS